MRLRRLNKVKRIYLYVVLTSLMSCLNIEATVVGNPVTSNNKVIINKISFYDHSRDRVIPVAFYLPGDGKQSQHQKVVIFNHGYGQNKGGDYLTYSYLTENLAAKGYFVVSIQHELPTDDLLAVEANLQVARKPNWERGVDNIRFVLSELKKTKPELDYNHVTLIGHSNGGDMVVLFAHKYPDLVDKIISMDNRRMPLPRTSTPKLFTLRSNDYPADVGVLPTVQEQKAHHITVQFVPINHGNMDDDASFEERKIMNNYIEKYLEG